MDEEEIRLRIYEKLQDSAEHHDHIAWFTSSILIAASVLMLINVGNIPFYFIKIYDLFGCCLSILTITLFYKIQGVKIQKYEKCKKIEEKFGKKIIISNHKYTEPLGLTPLFYCFLGIQLFIWLILLIGY